MINKCSYKNCDETSDIIYYDKYLCIKHWEKLCELSSDEMKNKLGVSIKKNTKEIHENNENN